jgi:broad specificity phosphatase PhoE
VSTLVLVRHGQARPFEKHSDQLSDTGRQQSVLLGEHWRQRGIKFDEVFCGSMQRHIQTAELAQIGVFESLPAFNEYDADGILRASPDYKPTQDRREFQLMFEVIMRQWIAGTLKDVESWAEFRERVSSGLRNIICANKPSRRVVVFTSGGPIGIAVQTALKAPEAMAIEINWRVRNCSLTEFVFTQDRVSLDVFNATPHLEEITFR